MALQRLLAKKRLGGELTEYEIREYIDAVVTENPDYEAQIGAMLMAIAIKGMSSRETGYLTKAMVYSGPPDSKGRLKWDGIVVDKHSTGGVGDKVSIPLAPILAELGLIVPMISGRGLEFTGGTLDKLESIRGFNVNLSEGEMSSALNSCGCCIASSTSSLCPADKRIYAIRDITSTVDSTPLIVASILSKKIAEGANYLIQDIKVGKAAFFKEVQSAEDLAKSMIATSKEFENFKMAATLTRMDTPIGNCVGNSLEIEESVQILRGEHLPADLIELICFLGGQLLMLSGRVTTIDKGKKEILSVIKGGKALKRFSEMCICQGVSKEDAKELCFGNMNAVLGTSKNKTEIKAEDSGFVCSIDALEVGIICWSLGSGRKKKSDKIDYNVGCKILLKPGEKIIKGQPWAIIYHNQSLPEDLQKRMMLSIKICDESIPQNSLIIKTVTD